MPPEDFDNMVPTIEYFVHRNNTPNWKIIPSRISFNDITYVIGGQAVYNIDGQEIFVKEGDLLCVPKNSFRYAISPTLPHLYDCFSINFQMQTLGAGDSLVPLPLYSHIGIHTDIISKYKKLNETWLMRQAGYQMRGKALFLLILHRYMEMLIYNKDALQLDFRIDTAIRYIISHYTKPLTVSKVAEVVSLNPVYFGNLFKRVTGITFRDYLNMVRLNQAEDMLRTGEYNVTESALRCGFTDVFYFSRLFKKNKGVVPSSIKPTTGRSVNSFL